MELNGQLHTLAALRPETHPALPLWTSLGAGLGAVVKRPVVLPSWMVVRFCRHPACSAVTLLACLLSYKCTFHYFCNKNIYIFLHSSLQWFRGSSFTRFLDHTRRRTTVGRTPLDKWSAIRKDLYLTSHITHNRQTSMPRCDSNPQSQQASGRRPTP
jgi:hypothetical protein